MHKCYGCAGDFNNWGALAQHIVDTNDKAHSNASLRRWAIRYNAGITHSPKDKLGYKSKYERQYDAKYKTRYISTGICSVCHKPFEGGKAGEICQC